MKIEYVSKRFSTSSMRVIIAANRIIEEYQTQGFKLTLRQLYYQFVTRNLIPNRVREYKRLGSIINDGRLAGEIDWEAIEDRTRELSQVSHWKNPQDILNTCAKQFAIDKWRDQKYRIEVWIEKEALSGVFEGICRELDVPFFCCRGYTSQSEMWVASMRFRQYMHARQVPYILHFGDHDPSGMDMTRDIMDRLTTFRCRLEMKRVALNMDQVEAYSPPPNPAREKDSRFKAYLREFGDESWELDALDPQTLANLVRDHVFALRDLKKWLRSARTENKHKKDIGRVADHWQQVITQL